MKSYARLTKAELIERLQALEAGNVPAKGSALSRDHGAGQQRTETALHDSEERMRAILENAVEGIITIDERGLIESVNPAAERMFGYAASQLIGQNVSMLMPQPDRGAHDGYIQNYLRTRQAKIIGIGREVVGQRADGSVFPMDLAVSEVSLVNRRLFTGFVRDITDRKRAEVRQAIQLEVARALTEATSLSEGAPRVMEAICRVMKWVMAEFWSVDRQANIIHHVQSWSQNESLSGEFESLAASLSCPPGKGLPGRVWSAAKPEWISHLAQEGNFLRSSAAARHGLRGAGGFPIVLGSEVLGVLVFFSRDERVLDNEALGLFGTIGQQIGQFIERKKAETKLAELARTLAEKNKELETIVYVASHDLRSPLVNIQGFSRELARACETIRQRLSSGGKPSGRDPETEQLLAEDIPEALEFILGGVKRMDALLSGFLRFSRLGRAAIKLERLDVVAMVGSILRTMDFQLKRAGATVEVQPLPACTGDSTQVNQVFSNLLDNAIKYLDPRRSGRVVISGHVENGRSIYAVRDNGIGIASEHQAKIFEIFHRLNPAASDGEGLGLTIAQRILERQGGRIWVQSARDQGSTFFVSLPYQP